MISSRASRMSSFVKASLCQASRRDTWSCHQCLMALAGSLPSVLLFFSEQKTTPRRARPAPQTQQASWATPGCPLPRKAACGLSPALPPHPPHLRGPPQRPLPHPPSMLSRIPPFPAPLGSPSRSTAMWAWRAGVATGRRRSSGLGTRDGALWGPAQAALTLPPRGGHPAGLQRQLSPSPTPRDLHPLKSPGSPWWFGKKVAITASSGRGPRAP